MKEMCEICGKRPAKLIILIENAKMAVCNVCGRSGKIIGRIESEDEKKIRDELDNKMLANKKPEEEIIENYSKIIKNARQKLKLPINVLAEKINEKLSYLEHIEAGKGALTIKTARKLERELGVKLIEDSQQAIISSGNLNKGKFSEPTLADMMEVKKKK